MATQRKAHTSGTPYTDKIDIIRDISRHVADTVVKTAENAEGKASTYRSHFSIFDAYSTTTNKLEVNLSKAEQEEKIMDQMRKDHRGMFTRMWVQLRHRTAFFTTPPEMWLFLIVLGLFTSFGMCVPMFPAVCRYPIVAYVRCPRFRSLAFDSILSHLAPLKNEWFQSRKSVGEGFAIWVGWTMFFTLLAGSVGHLISPFADGSGLPQIKSILGGSPLRNFFGWPVMFAKAIGCFFGLAAGLTMGKEGPFAHIAAIACHKLWRLPVFHTIRTNYSLRRQVVAAAVASGTASVMGAPVGALLFSIEITASYYLISNLWRGFLCSLVCVFTFSIIHTVKRDFTFSDTMLASGRAISWEALSFALLGVFVGLLGSCFVYAVSLALTFRRAYVTNPRTRYIYCAVVSFIIGVLTWTSDYARQNERDAVNALFEANIPVGKESHFHIFEKNDKFIALPVYFIIKFITCVLSITMPIPCGIFLPLLAVAGSFGRWYGEIVQLILSSPSEPGLYAVVGAAGLIAGATHTISPCVIIIEITSQANNLMPLLITTLVGYAVAGAFTISIYDMLMDISRLPYLPRVRNSSLYHLRAKDVMHPDVRVLTLESTVSDALSLLTYGKSPYEDSASVPQYPLVESERSMLFLGVVKRDDLERYVASTTRLGRILKLVRQSDAAEQAPAPAATFLTKIVADNFVPHHGPAMLRPSASANDIRKGTSGGPGQLSSTAGIASVAPAPQATTPRSVPVTNEAPKSSLLDNADGQEIDDDALVAGNAVGMTLSRPESAASAVSREHEDHKHAAGAAGAEETKFTTPERPTQSHGDSGSVSGEQRLQHVQSMPSLATSVVKHERDSHDDWLWARLPFDLDPDEQSDPEKSVSVDLAPFQVPELMSMPLLHFLFAICMYSRIYVTHHGRLTGVVYKGDFLDEKWLNPGTRR